MELLQRFRALNKEKIEAFVVNEQEEDVHLEFKTVNSSDMKHKDDKKNFAKALSGFANSSGGIIVWGIDARKNDRGIDSAAALKPLEDVSLFLTRLNEYEGQFVSPIVDGVRHKKIAATGTKGFAATLVPEGCSTPHMAKGGEDRYYKRSGDSFYRMEHFDIEDMFGRRKRPRLELVTELQIGGTITQSRIKSYWCKILVSLHNTGRGIAKYCHLHVGVNQPYEVLREGEGNLLPLRSNKRGYAKFGANADIVIHPDTIVQVISLRITVPESDPEKMIPDALIKYAINAEDMRSIEDTRIIKAADVIQVALSQRTT